MFDVFISHSSIDKKGFVEPLVDELNKLGLQVWYDKNSIHKGYFCPVCFLISENNKGKKLSKLPALNIPSSMLDQLLL